MNEKIIFKWDGEKDRKFVGKYKTLMSPFTIQTIQKFR